MFSPKTKKGQKQQDGGAGEGNKEINGWGWSRWGETRAFACIMGYLQTAYWFHYHLLRIPTRRKEQFARKEHLRKNVYFAS